MSHVKLRNVEHHDLLALKQMCFEATYAVEAEQPTLVDKLVLACLFEIGMKCAKKLLSPLVQKHNLGLTRMEALAIVIHFNKKQLPTYEDAKMREWIAVIHPTIV